MGDIMVDFRLEAISLLSKDKDEDQIVINNFINYGLEESIIENLFNNYANYKHKVLKNIPKIRKEYSFYFENFAFKQVSLINDFYLLYKKHKDYEKTLEIYYHTLFETFNLTVDTIDYFQITKIINGLEINDKDKLRLITFYNNKTLFDEIHKLIDDISKVLEKYYYIIEEDINKFKEKIKDKDYLVTNLNEILRSQHFKNNKFNINILIFPYNRLSIVDENIYIGYLVFELAILKKRYILDDQKLINALKAISDQTRFKVLKLLKERTWYAQELAEELNLSSATLNHHLSLLLNDNLISIELQESDKKKIYYSLNQKAFQEIITILKKTF